MSASVCCTSSSRVRLVYANAVLPPEPVVAQTASTTWTTGSIDYSTVPARARRSLGRA